MHGNIQNLELRTRCLKLVLEYDGTDFHGSQLQANGRTVQGELETALARLTGLPQGERVKVALAGRTDAGVHASGQVASFRTDSRHSLDTFRRGLNAILPFDLVVLEAEDVAVQFHARFSAIERRYHYSVLNRPSRSPLTRRYALTIAERLNLAAMNEAATRLVGEHDFASFAGAGWGVQSENHSQDESDRPETVRRLTQAEWRREGQMLVLELAANAFLPHMVRNIVGTLLLVGQGKRSPAQFEEILAARDRRVAGPTAPAYGLSLVEVRY